VLTEARLDTQRSILVLTTGGTIDKTYFDSLSQYQIKDTMVAHLLEVARVTLPFRIVEVARKDSLDLDDADRARLVEAARSAAEDRIVITHGTDTMTTSAAALGAIAGKTIVLVGALTPARFAESDAAFNLGMAFATAQVAPPGVYITMNGTVFRAGEVVKDRELGAFRHPGRSGPTGS
jgi:L-asparaginase